MYICVYMYIIPESIYTETMKMDSADCIYVFANLYVIYM